MGRKSDHGGEVTSSSIGANVKILWGDEELERMHFAALHVPWSFVGRLRDEAEKNEHNGVMTVDLKAMRRNGIPLFEEETFLKTFREVFVRRFVPCINEKFNSRAGAELTKLPDGIADSYRLLVLSERLKAAIREDVKEHIDSLLKAGDRAAGRPSEMAAFKLVHASIELSPPSKGTLQEAAVERAVFDLAQSLPESADALQELLELACSSGRSDVAVRIFKVSVGQAMGVRGGVRMTDQRREEEGFPDVEAPTRAARRSVVGREAARVASAKFNEEENDKERTALEELRRDAIKQKGEAMLEMRRLEAMKEAILEESSETANNNEASSSDAAALYALRQGLVLDKVCKNTGERIVRLTNDFLEWKKPNGKWASDRRVHRSEIVSVKNVSGNSNTFLVSTRVGLITLRAFTVESAKVWEAAVVKWWRSAPAAAVEPSPLNSSMASNRQSSSRRSSKVFSRLSFSRKQQHYDAENDAPTSSRRLSTRLARPPF